MTKNTVTLLTAILSLATTAYAGGASVVYDFVQRYPDAMVSNALSPATKKGMSNDVAKPSIFLHPTGSGDTTAGYSVELPKLESGEKLVFVYSAGISDGIPMNDAAHPFDGVFFELKVNGKKEFEADLKDFGWLDGATDLTSQAGKKVKVTFITRGNKNTNYDWALWGAPQIYRLSKSVLSGETAPIARGIVVARPSRDAMLTITPVGGGQPITINLAKRRFTAARFDFIPAGAESVKVGYTGDVKDIGVFGFSPQLQIVSFGPTSAVLYQGKPATLRAVVKNAGEGTLSESDSGSVEFGQSALVTGDGSPIIDVGLVTIETKPIGTLLPGESKTIECQFTPMATDGTLLVGATATMNGRAVDIPFKQVAAALNPVDPGKTVAAVEARQLPDGSVGLQNSKLRMQFLKSGVGFVAWTMSIPKGDSWEQVASGPFGKLVRGAAANQALEYNVYPSEAKTSQDSIVFSAKRDIYRSPCAFEWIFKLDAEQPKVSLAYSVKADQRVDILHFSGPTVYAGDGSFGGKKDEGLFPGLEYLLSEQSSGTEFVSPPNNLRTVPHPNKVTIPFMAIRNGGTLVMLEWDPLQKWAVGLDRPAPLFASPNFIEAQDNHLMGIFAPSVPDYTAENRLSAQKAFTLAAGESIRLEATLSVKADASTVLDALDEWLVRHGVPDPPMMTSSKADMIKLCNQSFLESSWDPTAKAWKHTNTSPAGFDPMIADYLFACDNRIYDEETSLKIRDVVRPATDKVKDSVPLSTSLYTGNVKAALDRQYQQIESIISSQREDGAWPYMPDKEHEVFGRTGDTSSGLTGRNAEVLLEHALMTADAKAKEAGLKALEFLDGTTRPEGAQTWELQLHVPDILASAYLVRAYLAGYRLTDDTKYLHRAVYWAKSGLPFVYLWTADDQPIMRYGTIPVFGATQFDGQPWFGVMVQWCGLEYGYSLDKLSDFDKSLPWKQISRGILYCGVQQQEYITREYPADAGMYPDAYSPIKGKEQYHWDLNPRLIARNLLRDIGADAEPTTHTMRDRRSQLMALTLPVQNIKANYVTDFLKTDFTYAEGATIYMVVGGIYHPETFDLNGEVIPITDDLSPAYRGWQLIEDRMLGIVKLQPRTTNHLEIDLIQHETYHPPGEAEVKPVETPE